MMHLEMMKQMIEFNKTAFDNTFRAMSLVQDQTEEMLLSYMEKATWLPAEGKKALKDWLDNCKKVRDEYKKIVDEGFKRMEELFEMSKKEAKDNDKKASK